MPKPRSASRPGSQRPGWQPDSGQSERPPPLAAAADGDRPRSGEGPARPRAAGVAPALRLSERRGRAIIRAVSAPLDFLRIFAGQLRQAGIPFAITSGMACVHYGLQQNTKDSDWRFLAVFSGMAALDVRVRLALVAHLD